MLEAFQDLQFPLQGSSIWSRMLGRNALKIARSQPAAGFAPDSEPDQSFVLPLNFAQLPG